MARRFVPLEGNDDNTFDDIQNREVIIGKRNLITDCCCENDGCPKTAQRRRILSTRMLPSQLARENRMSQQPQFSPKTVIELNFGPRAKVVLKIVRSGLTENGVRTDRCLSVLKSRVNETEFKRFVVKVLK